jgi:hypothetical protein
VLINVHRGIEASDVRITEQLNVKSKLTISDVNLNLMGSLSHSLVITGIRILAIIGL